MIDDLAWMLMRRRRDGRMRRDPVSLTTAAVGLGGGLLSAGGSYLLSKKNTPSLPPVRPTPDVQDDAARRARQRSQDEALRGRQSTILAQDNASGGPTYVNQTFGQ